MSVVKRIIKDAIERLEVDELLAEEFEQAGYGGITLTKTPLGAQINLFTMRPGRVIGRRGRSINAASERLEQELGLSNPQITVVEVEVPELDPRIMASRIANALERGVHYRRALFWALRRIMESGALGCEIVIRGKLRSDRSRYEKVSEGYLPKSGDPAIKHLKSETMHVKLKRGTLGINVTIVPPDVKFPDKISLDALPEVEAPEGELELPELLAGETEAAAELEVEPLPTHMDEQLQIDLKESEMVDETPEGEGEKQEMEKVQTKVESEPVGEESENIEPVPVTKVPEDSEMEPEEAETPPADDGNEENTEE